MTKLECKTGCKYGPTSSNPDVVIHCSVEIDEYSVEYFDRRFCIVRHDRTAQFEDVVT